MMKRTAHRLWAPIANAHEAYRRRLLAEPAAVYEHTWRLIHIHESLVVTLSALFASRLLGILEAAAPQDADRLRQRVTGLPTPRFPDVTLEVPRGEACLDGYIKPWIDLLRDFSHLAQVQGCDFCQGIKDYLGDKTQGVLPFLEPWATIADVPQVYLVSLSRIERFAAINALRNKLAHVPLPHRVLEHLHKGLRCEILSLLSPEYSDSKHAEDFVTKNWYLPLTGLLRYNDVFVTGSDFGPQVELDPNISARDRFVQAQHKGVSGTWVVSPFVSIDAELKVLLLFQLPGLRDDPTDEDFVGEYHRFAAELKPIQSVPVASDLLRDWIPCAATAPAPVPLSAENPPEPLAIPGPIAAAPDTTPPVIARDLRSAADEAFRLRDYPRAVALYDALEAAHDAVCYNDVAKSKHGGALWRASERESTTLQERFNNLNRAIALLGQGAEHRLPGYRSRALYERSKARWHLWRLNPEVRALLDDAFRDASDAARLEDAAAFLSWYERIRVDLAARGWLEPAEATRNVTDGGA